MSRRGGGAGCWSPGSGVRLGLLSSFLLLGHLRPRPRPLTPDPPLRPGRAVTADPNLSTPWCRESEPEQPLSPLQDPVLSRTCPRSGVWYSLGSASRRGLQTPPHPRLAARSAGSSSPRALEFDSGPAWPSPCPPGLPLAAIGGGYGERGSDLWDPGRQEGARARATGPRMFCCDDGAAPARGRGQAELTVPMPGLLPARESLCFSSGCGCPGVELGWKPPEPGPRRGGVGSLPASLLHALEKEERFTRRWRLARWQV